MCVFSLQGSRGDEAVPRAAVHGQPLWPALRARRSHHDTLERWSTAHTRTHTHTHLTSTIAVEDTRVLSILRMSEEVYILINLCWELAYLTAPAKYKLPLLLSVFAPTKAVSLPVNPFRIKNTCERRC